jgi:hypothetical protein
MCSIQVIQWSWLAWEGADRGAHPIQLEGVDILPGRDVL